jgi:putative membrane protein
VSDKNLNISIIVGWAVLFIALFIVRPRPLDDADIDFIRMAARTNLEEADLGQIAQREASVPSIKRFGQELSDDNETAYKELSDLAADTGQKIPAALDNDKEINHLIRCDGTRFDDAFLNEEVQAHKAAIAAFKNEAEHGENGDIKDWAINMIPTLEGHLQTAERLAGARKDGQMKVLPKAN